VADVPIVGQHGLRRKFYNFTSWHNTYHYKVENKNEETLALSFETPVTYHGNDADNNYITNRYKGWFIPPATTKYRFYQSCDDRCRLWLGSKPESDKEEDVTKLLDVGAAVYLREYERVDGHKRITEW
jgi:hypothetical protein